LFTLPAKAVLSLLNACNLSLITLQIYAFSMIYPNF